MRSGSGEILKLSWRHGFSPKARQISATVVLPIPYLFASPGRPMGVLSGGRLQGVDEDGLDGLVADLSLRSRTGGVGEPLEAAESKAVPPFRHSRGIHTLHGRRFSRSLRRPHTEHDLRPSASDLRRRVRRTHARASRVRPRSMMRAVGRPSSWHGALQMSAHICTNATVSAEIPALPTFLYFSVGRTLGGRMLLATGVVPWDWQRTPGDSTLPVRTRGRLREEEVSIDCRSGPRTAAPSGAVRRLSLQ